MEVVNGRPSPCAWCRRQGGQVQGTSPMAAEPLLASHGWNLSCTLIQVANGRAEWESSWTRSKDLPPTPSRRLRRRQGTAARRGRPMAPKPELTFLAWIHPTHMRRSAGESGASGVPWVGTCPAPRRTSNHPPHQLLSCHQSPARTPTTCGNQQGGCGAAVHQQYIRLQWGMPGQQSLQRAAASCCTRPGLQWGRPGA